MIIADQYYQKLMRTIESPRFITPVKVSSQVRTNAPQDISENSEEQKRLSRLIREVRAPVEGYFGVMEKFSIFSKKFADGPLDYLVGSFGINFIPNHFLFEATTIKNEFDVSILIWLFSCFKDSN